MNRVYIKTYGCQMNERDSAAVAELLRNRGYSIVLDEAAADIVLLNTCSIRDQSEQKAIGKAGHLTKRKRENPSFVLGVLGCMAQNRGSELLDCLPDIDLIVGTQKFHRTPDHLDNLISTMLGQGPRPSTIIDLGEEEGSQNTIRSHNPSTPQVSAFVSIMQGCDMKCAFCIVPKTRGSERSRPIEHIVDEINELVDAGTREVTLLGQIVTSYGKREYPSINGKTPFVQLIEQIHNIEGLERIRFTSPHPLGFRKDLVEAFGRLPKLGEYAHLPVQSGSDRILRAMNRPYSSDRYRRLVDDLLQVSPNMHFSTDVIVGFPGESEEDFELTVAMFESVSFDMAFVFKYSERSGTVAADLPDQIPKEIKERRNQILLQILGKQSLRRNRSLIGTVQEVLVEGSARKGDGMLMGRTRGFRKVVFPGPQRLIGELMDIRVTDASVTVLQGDPILDNDLIEESGPTLAQAS